MDVLTKEGAKKPNWMDFFESYWKLTYDMVRKSGLTDCESQEIIQEVIISVVQLRARSDYDPAKGSFNNWVTRVIQWHIANKLRRKHCQRIGTKR